MIGLINEIKAPFIRSIIMHYGCDNKETYAHACDNKKTYACIE